MYYFSATSDVRPDPDQKGKWTYFNDGEGSDISYDTRNEAMAALAVKGKFVMAYDAHAWTGLKGVFQSIYEQYKSRNGMSFTVLGIAQSDLYDSEDVGAIFIVQFDSGDVIEAWPDEIEHSLPASLLAN